MGGHEKAIRGYTDTWLTPRYVLDALGSFDTDPCCPEDMPWATADRMYTPSINGLMQEWVGRVWLNPPYGPVTGVWLDRLAGHGDGIALIFARTETDAFHRYVWGKADGILFFRKRLEFLTLGGETTHSNAGAPSCLVAYGQANVDALRKCGLPGSLVTNWERSG